MTLGRRSVRYGAMIALAGLLTTAAAPSAKSEIRPLDSSSLEEAKSQVGQKAGLFKISSRNLPKNSQVVKTMALTVSWPDFDCDLRMLTPHGQATRYAALAAENFIKLDSSNWRPDLFNKGVLVETEQLKSEMRSVVRFERIVCRIMPSGSVVEPLLVVFDSVQVSNLAGATFLKVEIATLFPIDIVNRGEDLQFYVFSNYGRKEVKVKAKELAKLR